MDWQFCGGLTLSRSTSGGTGSQEVSNVLASNSLGEKSGPITFDFISGGVNDFIDLFTADIDTFIEEDEGSEGTAEFVVSLLVEGVKRSGHFFFSLCLYILDCDLLAGIYKKQSLFYILNTKSKQRKFTRKLTEKKLWSWRKRVRMWKISIREKKK